MEKADQTELRNTCFSSECSEAIRRPRIGQMCMLGAEFWSMCVRIVVDRAEWRGVLGSCGLQRSVLRVPAPYTTVIRGP